MNKVLNFIERNIVITLLSEEHIFLNFLLYLKDSCPTIIPIETGCGGVKVSLQGIITIQKPSRKLDSFFGKEIIVVVDFRKLKLSFMAPLSKTASGLELVIPVEITRLSKNAPKSRQPASARFDFLIAEKTRKDIPCITSESLPPLSLVFINDKIMALSGCVKSFPLEKAKEYALQITCRTGQLNRLINAICYTAEIYTVFENEQQCAICVFTNIKAEDRRFLFEKR
jgi:hypothetical protein